MSANPLVRLRGLQKGWGRAQSMRGGAHACPPQAKALERQESERRSHKGPVRRRPPSCLPGTVPLAAAAAHLPTLGHAPGGGQRVWSPYRPPRPTVVAASDVKCEWSESRRTVSVRDTPALQDMKDMGIITLITFMEDAS